MKVYEGDRTIDGLVVTVDGMDLPDRTDVKCFSPGGFEWGYEGPAPTQLAFAILVDYLGDATRAGELAPRYMKNVVANFENAWEVRADDIERSLI